MSLSVRPRALTAFLKRPQPWLALALLTWGLAGWDLTRAPRKQVLARVYIGGVRLYHAGKARSGAAAVCRFVPSCSRYSIAAVEEHGLLKGLKLTQARLARCRTNVPKGTRDLVPPARP
jgi:putative membrane protein insertion efficiency factor